MKEFFFVFQIFMHISDKLQVLEKVLELMYDEINIDDGEGEEEITGDRDETDDDDLVEKNRDELWYCRQTDTQTDRLIHYFLAGLYESTGRAIAVTTASASALASTLVLLKMLKVFG